MKKYEAFFMSKCWKIPKSRDCPIGLESKAVSRAFRCPKVVPWDINRWDYWDWDKDIWGPLFLLKLKYLRLTKILLSYKKYSLNSNNYWKFSETYLLESNKTKNDLVKFNWNSSSSLNRVKWKSFVLVTGKLEVRKVLYLKKIIKTNTEIFYISYI